MQAARGSESRYRTAVVVATWIVAIVCLIALAEHLVSEPGQCELCGGTLKPYKQDDPEWFGSGIYECPKCGWMVNTRHSQR